ncbi:MAG: hypothetical protein RI979_623 [Pseudomonadota bacterium]
MKSPSLRVYAIAYLIFLYAPIILLPMFALNDSKVVQFPLKGFTFEWFREMTQDAQLGIAVNLPPAPQPGSPFLPRARSWA